MRFQLVRTPAGNFGRLQGALRAAGAEARLVDPEDLDATGGPVVLAGVSSFTTLCKALTPARETIRDLVGAGRPLLGICAGMQAMFESSEEGEGQGLGLFPGQIRRLRSSRIPNLGWSRLAVPRRSIALGRLRSGSYAYFAHSYRVPGNVGGVTARTLYRGESFPSVLERGAMWGFQFHPELSGAVGRQVLANFVTHCHGVDS